MYVSKFVIYKHDFRVEYFTWHGLYYVNWYSPFFFLFKKSFVTVLIKLQRLQKNYRNRSFIVKYINRSASIEFINGFTIFTEMAPSMILVDSR